MTTTETRNEAALLAEAERIADQIGLTILDYKHVGEFCLSWPHEHIWGLDMRPEPKGRAIYTTIAKIHKRICQYRQDFLFHHLALSWERGCELLPTIEADLSAACCWKALLANPHDEAALNGLKDWLDEREMRE